MILFIKFHKNFVTLLQRSLNFIYYFYRKMRWTSIFFRNAREPQNEKKVPFKAILPLKLRNHVSSKNQNENQKGMFVH